jgi:hypothetical protein
VGRRRVGPTCGFVASPEVGPGATVGTLQTGYPYIQALSQGKERDVYPRVATCTAASDPAFLPRWAPAPSRVKWLQTPPPC